MKPKHEIPWRRHRETYLKNTKAQRELALKQMEASMNLGMASSNMGLDALLPGYLVNHKAAK